MNNQGNFIFLDWQVYNDSQEAFGKIASIIEDLPKKVQYTVGNQIVRSALSVPLNIAEGCGRNTNKDINRFIDISLGSVNETVAALDSLKRMNYINDSQFKKLSKKYLKISKQLGGLKKYLKKTKKN